MPFLYTGLTPGVLASGQPISPCTLVDDDRVDTDHPDDARLIDEGVLVKQDDFDPAPKKTAKRAPKENN